METLLGLSEDEDGDEFKVLGPGCLSNPKRVQGKGTGFQGKGHMPTQNMPFLMPYISLQPELEGV